MGNTFLQKAMIDEQNWRIDVRWIECGLFVGLALDCPMLDGAKSRITFRPTNGIWNPEKINIHGFAGKVGLHAAGQAIAKLKKFGVKPPEDFHMTLTRRIESCVVDGWLNSPREEGVS